MLASCRASPTFCKARKVGSPASKEGQMVDGGVFRMVIRSEAVCCRKSRRVILGKGVSCGKKVAVSTIRSVRVFGK